MARFQVVHSTITITIMMFSDFITCIYVVFKFSLKLGGLTPHSEDQHLLDPVDELGGMARTIISKRM